MLVDEFIVLIHPGKTSDNTDGVAYKSALPPVRYCKSKVTPVVLHYLIRDLPPIEEKELK
jgi:hypothetical protein